MMTLSSSTDANAPAALAVGGDFCLAEVHTPVALARWSQSVKFAAPPLTTHELRDRPELLKGIKVLFTTWGAPQLDESLLAHADVLDIVLHAAGSVRTLVTDAFWQSGITLCSAYAANAVPVAEHTLGLVLLANKQVFRHQRSVQRDYGWPVGPALHELRNAGAGNYGATVGLVSFGAIGRLVREKLRGFDLQVLVHDPHLTEVQAAAAQVERVGLADLFARADIVSLHTPLLESTVGLIRGTHIRSMKPGATFINTARGAVVHEPELIAALCDRPDIQAMLDVTFPEPPVLGSALYSLPNVFLTPHIAGAVGTEIGRLTRLLAEELERWRRQEPLQWTLDRKKAESMT